MSVRFVFGRAGAGKTAYCLEQIGRRLEDAASEGPRLFLLVPEQASMQMERALLERPGVAGLARCEVLSFRRLAYRVLAACGGGVRTISATGRLMLLRRLVDEQADRLTVLGGVRGRRGLVDRLGRAIDELIREDVSPDDLAEACQRLEPQDDVLAGRLRDVLAIYRAYLDRLGNDLVDPGHHLAVVRERLDAYPALRGSAIWVDGFAGLTKQEHQLLVALAGVAERMEISLLVDPDSRVVQSGEPVESFHLFARTERTYVSLNRALRAADVDVADPLILRGPSPRFAASRASAQLERHVFSSPSRPGSDRSGGVDPAETIQLVQAATRRVEVAAAVAEIQRLVRDPNRPMRYRDIAIIVRNLEPYHDLLTAALTAAGIGHFIDRRRPVAHHALVELVRSVIDLARHGGHVGIEPIATFVKTGLAGLADDEVELLENHLRGHGIADRSSWREGDWTYRRRPSRVAPEDEPPEAGDVELARLNDIRQRLTAALEPWWELADASEPLTAHQWARGLFDLLGRLGVPEQIAAWADQADRDKRIDEAAEHRQVWTHLVELLDDLSGTFGDDSLSVDEFAEVVDTALSSATLGLAPPTLDQVLVGSIERSRHPPIRAALILGFAEGEFPQRPAEDPIFSDRHRIELAKTGVELAPTSRQQLFDERLLAYIALTRPSERLWISWPAAEQDGRVCHPSPFVEAIRAVFPHLKITQYPEPTSARETWPVATIDDLAGAVAADLRTRTRQVRSDPHVDRRWNALYEWARQDDRARDRLRRATGSLVYRNDAVLADRATEQLFGQMLVTSVSRVELFASCPFRHFAGYGLRLEPRAEWELDAVDLGLIGHRVLEAYVGPMVTTGKRLADLELDDLEMTVHSLSHQALDELTDELLLADARNAYLVEQGDVDLVRTLRAQRFVAAAGAYRPAGVEVCFGMPAPQDPAPGQAFLPPLRLVTPAGRTMRLRGRIDRLDLAELGGRVLATVVDYKRSPQPRLGLDRVYHGLDLQLLTYLLVIAEHGSAITDRPVEPAGAFYATLLDKLQRLDGPPEAPPDEADRYKEIRPRGVFNFDVVDAFDSQMAPGSSSGVLSAYQKRDGSPGNLGRTDAAEHRAFVGLLDHVRQQIGALCDRMLDGVIAVDPYRLGQETPCTYCPYRSVCRFEFDAHRPRRLPAMSRTDVLDRVCRHGEEVNDD